MNGAWWVLVVVVGIQYLVFGIGSWQWLESNWIYYYYFLTGINRTLSKIGNISSTKWSLIALTNVNRQPQINYRSAVDLIYNCLFRDNTTELVDLTHLRESMAKITFFHVQDRTTDSQILGYEIVREFIWGTAWEMDSGD